MIFGGCIKGRNKESEKEFWNTSYRNLLKMLWPMDKKGQNKDAEKGVRINVYMKEKMLNGMTQKRALELTFI
jgi:hypothetical protein